MKYLICLFSLFLLLGCDFKNNKHSQTTLSYYYWRTSFQLDSIEKKSLEELNVKKLYIRYFDVVLQGNQAIPVSPIIFKESLPQLEVVPVVYIKNEVLINEQTNLYILAEKIVDFIRQVNDVNDIDCQEIQLDCDWTLQSKDRFFKLIEYIKKDIDWKLTSTIRLHQVKYASKTGIPDVDSGVLMYYNMGTIASDSLNSIYDRSIAKKYIGGLKDYPLALDYAFPIYSWVVQSRNGKVIKLISRVRLDDLKEKSGLKQISEFVFSVQEEGLYFGEYFQGGDQVKVESIKPEQLQEMKQDLYQASGKCPSEIILYDLNSKNVTFYEKEVLEELSLCK